MNKNIEVSQMKCACPNCLCIVSIDKAIKDKSGKVFCSEICAGGHKNEQGCGHNGCDCGKS